MEIARNRAQKRAQEIAKKTQKEPTGPAQNFLSRPLELIYEDEVNAEYGVAITYVLQLLRLLFEAGEAELVKGAVKADKLADLLVHSCVNVRLEAVKLFAEVLQDAAASEAALDLQWIDKTVMKQVKNDGPLYEAVTVKLKISFTNLGIFSLFSI